MGHLHPDLVPPAGQKPDLNQTPSPAFFQNPVGQVAFLRSRRIRRTDAGPVLPGVLRQVIHQHAFFFRKFSTYQGPIPFFHTCMIRCLPAQIRRRITIFRHQQDSLHRLVQPVHQPELYLLPPAESSHSGACSSDRELWAGRSAWLLPPVYILPEGLCLHIISCIFSSLFSPGPGRAGQGLSPVRTCARRAHKTQTAGNGIPASGLITAAQRAADYAVSITVSSEALRALFHNRACQAGQTYSSCSSLHPAD